MSISILKKELKAGIIRNLYLFCGPEEYLKKYYLDSIRDKLLSENLREMNMMVLEGKVEIEKLKDYCTALPMFSEHKMVIVKNSGFFRSQRKSGEGDSEATGEKESKKDELSEFLANVPSYTCLVFVEDDVNRKLRAVNAIKKHGLVVEFDYQKPADLAKWVVKVFEANKKKIDMVTASMIVENSEPGMTEILNEVNKVILFVGERTRITDDDIKKVCTKSIKSMIFDLTDAAAERDSSKALKLLNDMISLKEPVPKIFFMLTRQLRLVLQMKLLTEEGMSTNQAISRMRLTPYAARKIVKQAQGFSAEMLKEVLEECLKLDEAVKSGRLEDRAAVELLITMMSFPIKTNSIKTKKRT